MDQLLEEQVMVKRKQGANIKGGAKRLKVNKHGEVFSSLATRTLPINFVKNVIKKLTVNQTNSIREMGFGFLEHMEMEAVPLRLGYWLADRFDAHKRCIRMMSDGDKISFDDKDVYIAMGLLMGRLEVRPAAEGEECQALAKWKEYVSPGKESIFQKELYKKILEDGGCGIFFKQSFAILVISMLIESTTTGALNLEYFKMLEDVDRLQDYNWCQFLIDRLVLAKIAWDKNRTGWFRGSILFLMLLYVDRVEHLKNYNVPRHIPAFLNWTGVTLLKREKMEVDGGGFGHGFFLDRQDIPEPSTQVIATLTLKEMYMTAMSTLSTSIANIVRLTKEGLETLGSDIEFYNMVETVKRLIGEASTICTDPHVHRDEEHVPSTVVGLIENVGGGTSICEMDAQGANDTDMAQSPTIPSHVETVARIAQQTITPSNVLPAQSLNQRFYSKMKHICSSKPSTSACKHIYPLSSGMVNTNQQASIKTHTPTLQKTPQQASHPPLNVETMTEGRHSLITPYLPLQPSSTRNNTPIKFDPTPDSSSKYKFDIQQKAATPEVGKVTTGHSSATSADIQEWRTSP